MGMSFEIQTNELARNNKVTLYWVPGHVGVKNIEEASTRREILNKESAKR